MRQNAKLLCSIAMFLITLYTRPTIATKSIESLYESKSFDLKDSSAKTPKQHIDIIYRDIPDASYGDQKDKIRIREDFSGIHKTGGNPIYGEMLYESIEMVLLNFFRATSEDIFMDLGSGSGKAPIQFTLLTGGKSIGLEYVRFRHELALRAHAELPSHLKPLVEFIQADMFTYPIPSATIYLINACTFSKKYPEIVEFLLKYGPTKFKVWSIGEFKLPFPPEKIKNFIKTTFAASWAPDEHTTLYWIEK